MFKNLIVQIVKKAASYSILDDLVDVGAERVKALPRSRETLVTFKPPRMWIGNFRVDQMATVYLTDQWIYIRKGRTETVRILLSELKQTGTELRPLSYHGVRLSFGEEANVALKRVVA